MNFGLFYKVIVIVATVVVHTISAFSFNNPLDALKGVAKNDRSKLLSEVMGSIRHLQRKNPLSSMLLQGRPVFNMNMAQEAEVIRKPVQKAFSWSSCGPANPVIEIKNLTVKPAPLSIPGEITFGFDAVFHDDITEDDKVTVALTLDIAEGSTWLKIPCIGQIGSCTYNNICSQLHGLTCPPSITKQVPCNCPIKKGEYKLHPYSIEVDAEVFMHGRYQATANMTSVTKGHVGCYKINFEIE